MIQWTFARADICRRRFRMGTSAVSHLRRAEVGASAETVPRPRWRWKTRLLLPVVILLAIAAILFYSARDSLSPAMAVKVVPVVARSGGAVAGGTVIAQAPGWVEPAPYPVTVSAQIEGIVSEVLVLEGQSVEAKQLIARLVDDGAKLGVTRARAELAQRNAELRAAAIAAGLPETEGATGAIKTAPAGAVALAEVRAELAKLPSEIKRLKAKLDEIEVEYGLKKQAVERGLVSEVALKTLSAKLEAQLAELEAAKAQEPVLQAKLRQTENEIIATLEKARAGVANAAAMLEEAQLRLNRTEIRSPMAGVVMARLVEPGSALTPMVGTPGGSAIVKLYDPAKLQVRVDVPLASAGKVGAGTRAQIVVDVLPDQTFDGEVSRVTHEADIQRNTLQFKVAVKNPSPLLKPEMLARVKFISAPSTQPANTGSTRLFAPISVVGTDAGKTAQVWVADPNRNVAISRSVVVGTYRVGDWIEVSSGLNPGDKVIVNPPQGLREGRKVSIENAMLNGPQAAGGNHGAH
jgi:HlyD family secretion protein